MRPKTYLLFFLISLCFFACNEEEKQYTSIIFEEEFQKDSVKVYYFDLLSQKQISIPKITDESSKNEIKFELESETYAYFEYQDSTFIIYLEPGFQLRHTFLTNSLEKPKSVAEQYHHEFRKVQRMFFDNEKPYFFQLSFEDFKKRQNVLTKEHNKFQQEIDNPKISELVNGFFETKMAVHKLNYTLGNYDLYTEPNEETLWLLENEDFQISKLQFDRNNLEGNFVVQMYIDAIVYPELSRQEISDSNTKNNLPQAIEFIKKSNINQSMKEWLIAQSIFMKIYASGLDSINISALENFQSEYDQSNFSSSLTELKAETETLNPGSVIPNLTAQKQDSTIVSLHDLKGKIFYLDIWATWCAPCIEQMPYSKKLEERFKDKNIEFVYLSVDRDEENWKHFINEKELSGIQLKAFDVNGVYEDLKLFGVPRYLLIDENSRIIDAYAPRPSDDEIYDLIAKHLPKS